MALSVMVLDVREFRSILKSRDIPIQISEPLMNVRISRANILDVRLEVLYINHIEPHNRGEQPHIWTFRLTQVFLYSIQTLE
jgi:hypothetical protein